MTDKIETVSSDSIKNVEEEIARLTALTQRKMDLLAELDRALALQRFEPRAFEFGACKTTVTGNIRHAPRRAVFTILLRNGEDLEYPLMAVPYRLWPRSVKDEFQMIPAHVRRGLEKELVA
jgi:hypothetical protein